MGGEIWKKNPNVVARRIGDDTVLVPTGKDIVDLQCLFSLNETGSFIWEQLEKPCTGGQITEAMIEKFDVTPEQAQEDVTRFLDVLSKEGCIVAGGEP